jgi:hypothetical protein|uniref:Uncharacterized protein n=1 Tax=Pygoscelis antarcticus TaxID=79643 RepID=A0A7G7LKI7_PYGAN|nr:hypothetical protein [Pygoscelis antarcticus]QNG40989.1 hypothetical protein [Pygoscelis antarcticus]QNG40991.1 hypothetical protein [Pygoscelis antarcticus]QNG40994.1 hypothetical protein [Pygoscelis antarcticus]QNG40996.1 hypothetical protein [Pygoscelis antarcticus]
MYNIRLPFEKVEFNTYQEYQDFFKQEDEYRQITVNLFEKYECISSTIGTVIKSKGVKKEYSHLFITVNPPPTLSLNDFLNQISKTMTKNWIDSYLYVIEQRGENETDIGKGVHTHILLKLTKHKKQSEITREIKNTWKKVLDVDNYHILNIKYIDDLEQKRKQNYILGTKTESVKHLKQAYDIIYRKNNKLQKYYNLHYNIEDVYLNG